MNTSVALHENKPLLETLSVELAELRERYSRHIAEESLQKDIDQLKRWIDACSEEQSESALVYLQEHGPRMIENIRAKLKLAAEELQRIDEESPAGRHFSGSEADRKHQAAAVASQAQEDLSKTLEVIAEPEKE
jgi:hypothetical protein